MNRLTVEILATIHNILGVRVAALSLLVVAFSATTMAQCGGSFSAMAGGRDFHPKPSRWLGSNRMSDGRVREYTQICTDDFAVRKTNRLVLVNVQHTVFKDSGDS